MDIDKDQIDEAGLVLRLGAVSIGYIK